MLFRLKGIEAVHGLYAGRTFADIPAATFIYIPTGTPDREPAAWNLIGAAATVALVTAAGCASAGIPAYRVMMCRVPNKDRRGAAVC